jgi:bifunctional non-homologous end joining protein LigD
MAAKLVDRLPEGEEWLYEVKFDGYRALVIKDGSKVRLRSRNDKDLAGAYPGIAGAGGRLRAEAAIVDGEVVAVDRQGHPSFQALQNRGAHSDHAIVFYAFDLLHRDGRDLTRYPLIDRKAELSEVLEGSGLLLSATLPGTAAQVTEAVRRLGLEGVIAKRRDSIYSAGLRPGSWVKLKPDHQQEFVVGGYRPGTYGVDALLVGFYSGKALRFAGKVRAGFTPHTRLEVFDRLKRLHVSTCPFADLPDSRTSHWGGGVTAGQMNEMQWVRPRLVAQIRFVEWTADGHLRHAAYLGLRADKPAAQVGRSA